MTPFNWAQARNLPSGDGTVNAHPGWLGTTWWSSTRRRVPMSQRSTRPSLVLNTTAPESGENTAPSTCGSAICNRKAIGSTDRIHNPPASSANSFWPSALNVNCP